MRISTATAKPIDETAALPAEARRAVSRVSLAHPTALLDTRRAGQDHYVVTAYSNDRVVGREFVKV